MLARLVIISLVFTSFVSPAHAKKVDGYIITNNNDTIYGAIRLSKFNLLQNTISISSYNMDELYDHLYFRSSTDKKFNELSPMDILEYGFILDRTQYRYISKEVKAKLGTSKRKFYLQLANGDINLFESRTPLNNQDQSLNHNRMIITEFYILGEDKNLIRVSQNDKDERVSDFLMKNLKLDKETLDKAAKDKTFKDIVEIARVYNNDVAKPAK